MIRSIMAGVLRGVVSQRLLPRIDGGRVAAVEVMVTNTRIADLIREDQRRGDPRRDRRGRVLRHADLHAGADRARVSGKVDREIAANAATNRHDFLVSLERALKQQSRRGRDGRRRGRAQTATADAGAATPEPSSADAPPRAKPETDAPPRRLRRSACACWPARPARRGPRARLLGLAARAGPARSRSAERVGPECARLDLVPIRFTSRLRARSSCRSRPCKSSGSGRAPPTGSPGRCLRRSTRSSPTSARTWGRARPVPWAGCSSCPSTWLRWGVDADGDGIADPWNADRRGLRRCALSRRRRRPDRHRARRLLVQPRRLVRPRGARSREVYGQGGITQTVDLQQLQAKVDDARAQKSSARTTRLAAARDVSSSSGGSRSGFSARRGSSVPLGSARCRARAGALRRPRDRPAQRPTAARDESRAGAVALATRARRTSQAPSFAPGADADGRRRVPRRLRLPRRRRPAARVGRAHPPRLPRGRHRRARGLARLRDRRR